MTTRTHYTAGGEMLYVINERIYSSRPAALPSRHCYSGPFPLKQCTDIIAKQRRLQLACGRHSDFWLVPVEELE